MPAWYRNQAVSIRPSDFDGGVHRLCSAIEGLLRKCATTKRNSEEPSGIVNFRGLTTRVMRIDRQRFSSLLPDGHARSAPSICLVGSPLSKKQLGGQTSLLKRVACTPDRGDVCIMQGQIGGVNGFVVNNLRHYILSDKMVWVWKMG